MRIERGVDRLQKRDDIRIRIANAADFEVIAIHVENMQTIAEDVDLAEALEVPSAVR